VKIATVTVRASVTTQRQHANVSAVKISLRGIASCRWVAADERCRKAGITAPDERLPATGTAEPGSAHDPEAAEACAESVGTGPSHDQINEYLKRAGAEPLTDPPDTQWKKLEPLAFRGVRYAAGDHADAKGASCRIEG
jgi:hypothetical protein